MDIIGSKWMQDYRYYWIKMDAEYRYYWIKMDAGLQILLDQNGCRIIDIIGSKWMLNKDIIG